MIRIDTVCEVYEIELYVSDANEDNLLLEMGEKGFFVADTKRSTEQGFKFVKFAKN
jgi:hypothetical protein